mmetsp:Transcript_1457/g.2961  ORF Transcript_1457/g.2961 Transcript_1457/m.2961 type:complete len:201 (+) Transcript_1457:140-742(+)
MFPGDEFPDRFPRDAASLLARCEEMWALRWRVDGDLAAAGRLHSLGDADKNKDDALGMEELSPGGVPGEVCAWKSGVVGHEIGDDLLLPLIWTARVRGWREWSKRSGLGRMCDGECSIIAVSVFGQEGRRGRGEELVETAAGQRWKRRESEAACLRLPIFSSLSPLSLHASPLLTSFRPSGLQLSPCLLRLSPLPSLSCV